MAISSDFGTEISFDDLSPLSVIHHSSPINTKEHPCTLHTPLLMLIWHFLYLILMVCLISIFFHDSYNRCLRDSNSFRTDRVLLRSLLFISLFTSEGRPFPLGNQHRTYALQTSSSGRQQSLSGFLFLLHWEYQDQGLHQHTATLLFYYHWHVAFSGGLYLWIQNGFKLFIHFFLVDPL